MCGCVAVAPRERREPFAFGEGICNVGGEPLQYTEVVAEPAREPCEILTHVGPFLQGPLRVDDLTQVGQHVVLSAHRHAREHAARERRFTDDVGRHGHHAVNAPLVASIMIRRESAELLLHTDSIPLRWSPRAKDGADLPLALRGEQPAQLTRLAVGETYDFTWRPTHAQRAVLEVRVLDAKAPFRIVVDVR